MSGRRVLFFGSQVAAVLGRHPYQKRSSAFEATWQRFDASSYDGAFERAGVATEEQAMAGELAEAGDDFVRIFEDPDFLLKDRSAQDVQLSLATLPQTASRALRDHARSAAFGAYGTRRESRALELLEERHGISTRPVGGMFYWAHPGDEWMVGGRIDAMTTEGGCVVEVKNRVTRAPGNPPDYELDQLRTYLKIHAAERGYLFEVMEGPDGPITHLTVMEADAGAWAAMERGLGEVATLVRLASRDAAVAGKYVVSKQKTRWISGSIAKFAPERVAPEPSGP